MVEDQTNNIRLLLPVGSHITLNPNNLKEAGLHLGILGSKGKDIVNFEYTHPVAYSDNEVYCMVISYEVDINNPDIFYIALMPDEKEDTILFIRVPKVFKGFLGFLTLLDQGD